MVFLSPLTLIGLLLVALPIIIHLLVRRRARRLDFPSLAFLRETQSFKLSPRRIRQPLLLALRAAAIILLVFGVARPLFTHSTQSHTTVHFILMDASLSMKTRGRAEAAREQTRAIVNKLAGDERATIITFSSEATALAELSSDRTQLMEAIARYQPTGGAPRYEAAFAEVNAQLQRWPQASGEINLISDFQRAALEEWKNAATNAPALPVVTYPIGSEVERNAFLIDETARMTEHGLELSATEIVAEATGRRGARESWTIEQSAGTRSGIEWRTETNGQMTGRIKALEPDDFDADDERFFAFQPPHEARVLLIEEGGDATLYLRAALEAASDEGRKKIALDRRRELPVNASELAPYSLVVVTLHGAARESEAEVLTEYARAGGQVCLFLADDLDTESWNALAQRSVGRELPFEKITRITSPTLSFSAGDWDSQPLGALDQSSITALRAVRIKTGYALGERASAFTLMRWNDGSAAFVSERIGAGEMMLLATAPERAAGNLGASPSFPSLISSILRSTNSSREPLSQTIGEPVRVNTTLDADVTITSMEGRAEIAKARELVSRPLRYFGEPGIYKLEFAGTEKFMAFNSPAVESERALATADELKRFFSVEKKADEKIASQSNQRSTAERSDAAWRYFLIAAFMLMIAELFVAVRQRRIESAGNNR